MYTAKMEIAAPRRPFRFRLKRLFLVIARIGVVAAIIAHFRRADEQKQDEDRVANELFANPAELFPADAGLGNPGIRARHNNTA